VEPEAFVEYLCARFRSYYDLGQEAPSARSMVELPALFKQLAHFKSFADLLLMP
jgi:hypothetical protein